jgi:hypothetical protein
MRSDYPNADLINKVNSEWISKVLHDPELGGAVSVDDDDDLTPQRDFTRRLRRMRCELAPPAARSKPAGHRAPGIAVTRVARAPRGRSVARRVTERLVLGIAALGLGAAVWMTPGFQDASNTVSATEANAATEDTPQIDTTALKSMEPAWLSPEILYATAIAPPPTRRAEAVPVPPRLGR